LAHRLSGSSSSRLTHWRLRHPAWLRVSAALSSSALMHSLLNPS
jgi:hypothetical protein